MKILFLTNNPISNTLSDWLKNRTEPNENNPNNVIIWNEKIDLKNITEIQPNIVISYSYQHIIRADVLDSMQGKFINLHISLLPYNRGADPNAWSFLENTPKGVTIHQIDQGVDTGPILIQKEIFFDEDSETLGHSYEILQDEIQDLFRENWDKIRDQLLVGYKKNENGTHHFSKEFRAIKDHLMGEEGWNVKISVFKERFKNLNFGA
jgi:methionyl-tRNA formyltransferase